MGCEKSAPHDAAIRRRAATATPLPAPPRDPTNRVADDPRAAHFGQWLFYDPRLSGPGTFSCASCHDPEHAFTDGKPVGEAIGVGRRHTPSLLNVAHHRWVGWDGRSDSIWAQALRPMEDANEMGGDRVAIAHLVLEDPALRAEYEAIFGTVALDLSTFPDHAKPGGDEDLRAAWEALAPLQQHAVMAIMANIGKALAAYQRRLVSDDAPFDRFMAGDGEISESAERGMQLFFGRAECWECHTGPLFSDGEFHNIGIPPTSGGLPRDKGRYAGSAIVRDDPFNAAGAFSDAPQGLWATVVGNTRVDPETWGAFKTPSLRGVSATPPYMHAGQLVSLQEVVQFYSTLEGAVQLDHHQESVLSPLGLSEEEIADLVAFLGTLQGRLPAPELLMAPLRPTFSRDLGTESP
jgi:cytochrome c peroxidase